MQNSFQKWLTISKWWWQVIKSVWDPSEWRAIGNYLGHILLKLALSSATSWIVYSSLSILFISHLSTFAYPVLFVVKHLSLFLLRIFIQLKKCCLFWGSIELETYSHYKTFYIATTCLQICLLHQSLKTTRAGIMFYSSLCLQPQNLLQERCSGR